VTTPSALSPEQSPEQPCDGSLDTDVEQERAQEPAPTQAETPDTAPAGPDAGGRTETELRTALGLGPVDHVPPRAVRIRGWIATGVVGVIAALLRLIGLGHPKTLMFDEIYYVKDAYALWHLGYEGNWANNSDAAFASGDFSGLSTDAAYVVHPQLGKWLIGAGMEVFGPSSSFGWRVMPAIAGILTVILLTRLTMRLTRSPLLAGLAGLFLAIDGVALTESRIGLLDVFIGFFATLSLYCLVRDREWSRARLARRMAGTKLGARAPHATIRPWLLATGVTLGLTCSIKWSGLYLVAVVGIAVVIWDTLALRRVGARAWFLEGTVAQGVSDFFQTVPVAVAVYVGCWWSWFTHPLAFKHGWTAEQLEQGQPVPLPWLSSYVDDSLFQKINDFVAYHQQMYEFHVGLASPHTYQSKPYGWLLQTRPAHILSYVPWFQYRDRTIFTFYTVAFVPCVVLILVLALGMAAGLVPPLPGSKSAEAQVEALRKRQIGPGIRPWRGVGARFLGFGPQFGRTRVWTPPVVETDPGMYRIVETAGNADDDLEAEDGAPAVAVDALPRAEQDGSQRAQAMAELTGYGTTTATAPDVTSDSDELEGTSRRSPWATLKNWTSVPTWQIRSEGIFLTIMVTALACVAAAFWWPIWTGQNVSRAFWLYHMFLSSWI